MNCNKSHPTKSVGGRKCRGVYRRTEPSKHSRDLFVSSTDFLTNLDPLKRFAKGLRFFDEGQVHRHNHDVVHNFNHVIFLAFLCSIMFLKATEFTKP